MGSNPYGPIPFGNLKTVADNIVDLVEPRMEPTNLVGSYPTGPTTFVGTISNHRANRDPYGLMPETMIQSGTSNPDSFSSFLCLS
jgi:hypothetical protein